MTSGSASRRGERLGGLLRNLAITLVLTMLRVGMRVLSVVVPTSRRVVVSGFPDTEGNALETARALLRRYDGRVVWLTESPTPHRDVLALAEKGMVLTPKSSPAGLWHYLRAEAVFFTHGLYGSPRPSRRKPLVNLWHGDGPKKTRPGKGAGSIIPSTYLVASTTLFGRYKAEAFEVPRDRLLVVGNPRTDQFWAPASRQALARLGITGEFVVWMPTFRSSRAVGAVRPWSESGGGPDDYLLALKPLTEGLQERGIQLVVKPHPMDADARNVEGALTITNEDLTEAGTSLYAVLGRARGLVTDYSSVWVDFLLVDRPIAFHVPDRDSYTRTLVPADTLDWLPGELVTEEEPFGEFLADLDADGAKGRVLRGRVAGKVGLNPTSRSADALVTALVDRGALSTR